jgi:sugar transferase (PEP-CTERM system associated)
MKLFHHHVHQQIVLLAAIELLLFSMAPFVAAMIRFGPELSQSDPRGGVQWIESAIFAGVLSLAATAMGLYSRRLRARSVGLLARFVIAVLATIVVMAIVFYLVPELFLGRGMLLLSAVIAFVLFACSRWIFEKFFEDQVFRRRVLVYGTGRRVVGLSMLRRRSDQRGFDIIGYLPSRGDADLVPERLWVRQSGSLLDLCVELDVDEIVVGMDDRRVDFPLEPLMLCKMKGIEVTEVIDFLERETGKIHLNALSPAWIIFAKGFDQSRVTRVFVRALDVLVSAVLLLLSWPIMLAAALAILIEDGPSSPILYKQTRVGVDGRRFQIVKFRTMRVDAEASGVAQWARTQDSRITRVGAFLRKSRLDELPQLWNVFAGHMSLVGPRPERPEFVEELENSIPFYHERHVVKPGLSGWAQLCYPYGASEQDAIEKLQYDLFYVKNRSLLLNLVILIQTVEVVLFGKGSR